MNEKQKGHLVSWMAETAAEFIVRRVSLPSGTLATVTRVELAQNLKRAIVFVSVWPETKEVEVLKLIRAVRHDFYEYAEKKFKINQRIAVTFEIDRGEKARVRVEKLLRETQ
jgi:ribosome-binding factor A